MRKCPRCGAQIADDARFCTNCGQTFAAANDMPASYTPPAAFDPYDHTAEFDKQDISDNKIYAMLPYLNGVIGIIIALLAAAQSPYVSFHIRQAIKFSVANTLLGIVAVLLSWTFIVPIACLVCIGVLGVVKIIMFFSICQSHAVEPFLIRNLPFFK